MSWRGVLVPLVHRLIPTGVALSVISYMEVYQGVLRGLARPDAVGDLTDVVPILDVTPGIARRCAALRETLQQQGKRVRPRALDLIVAATALEYDLTLVTRNVDDFHDIPGLRLHQW